MSLRDLPFRLVVYGILVFHLVDLERTEGDLSCFGYFKSDSSRKIFHIFPSIRFERGLKHIINPSNIVSLFMNNPEIIAKLKHFEKIESMNLSVASEVLSGYERQLKELFSPSGCYKSLKRLSIDYYSYEENDTTIDSSFWFLKERIWKNLDDLSLNFSRFNVTNHFPLEKHAHLFLNLKCISLGHIRAPIKTVIQLPNIQKVTLEETQRIIIHSGTSSHRPISLRMRRINISEVMEMIQHGNQFSTIEVNGCEGGDDSFDFLFNKSTIRKQKFLTSLHLYKCNFSEGAEFEVCDDSLEVLMIGECSGCKLDPFLRQDFPVLRSLYLFSFTNLNYLSASFTYTFTNRLRFLFVEVEDLPSDDLFTGLNGWDCLEKLALQITTNEENRFEPEEYYKKKWNEMANLRTLELFSMTTKIMAYQTLPSLEKIVFRRLEIFPKMWNPVNLQNLKKMVISFHKYRGINEQQQQQRDEEEPTSLSTDVIFQENEFLVLEELKIDYCSECYGIGWKSIPSLRKLRVSQCRNFGDHLFQGECVKFLRYLSIRNCMKIKQVKWINFVNMKEIDVVND